jgi:Fur family ferric uptake transcriptional regulator
MLPTILIANISQLVYSDTMPTLTQKYDLASLLHGVDLKATRSRLALLQILQEAEKPLAVHDILNRTKEKSADQATIYRTLKELKEANIIRQIDFQHGHAHYELTSRGDHHHLVCEKCRKVEDINDCSIPAIQKKIRGENGFLVRRHSLEFFGLCKKCQKNKYKI